MGVVLDNMCYIKLSCLFRLACHLRPALARTTSSNVGHDQPEDPAVDHEESCTCHPQPGYECRFSEKLELEPLLQP